MILTRARSAFLFFLCSFLCVLVTSASAQIRRPRATVTPLVEREAHPGETARVALKVSLPEGLHTQSNKPRDENLIPTELSVTAPPGVTVKEIVWPPATDLKQNGALLAVFEQTFAIGVELAIDSSVRPGDLIVPAGLRYQACDANLCYAPASAVVQWTIPVLAAGTTNAAAADPVFAAIKFGTGEKPSASSTPPVAVGGAKPVAATPSGNDAAKLDAFNVLGTTGGYQGTGDFLKFIHDAETGVKQRGLFEGRGPLMILLIVLVGGLALNLTPCVLPMIPINLAIIGAGAQASSRARGFLLGSAYGGAMAIVYGVLGLVVILTAGTFGTINASPWFNLGIAILFVVLGLAMFDVLLIDFSKYSNNIGTGAGRGTFALAFTMGAVAALLAGACVAPVA
jgi:thiol:disulfide interchange protein DsbD